MLSPATLNLDSYFFSEVNASLDMNTFAAENSSCKISREDLNSEFTVFEDSGSGENLILKLKITTDPAPEKKMSFSLSIEIIGRFLYSKEMVEKFKSNTLNEAVVVANALSILYGSIRDQVHTLTAKMACGPIYLPTCTFNVQKHESPDSASETETKPKTKKASTKKPA